MTYSFDLSELLFQFGGKRFKSFFISSSTHSFFEGIRAPHLNKTMEPQIVRFHFAFYARAPHRAARAADDPRHRGTDQREMKL
jgi:hypothetical protein